MTNLDGAAGLTAPVSGVSYALYRFALGGVQPATLSVDANVHLNGGQLGAYWVGVSDYGNGTWEWRGPFTESQVTLTLTPGADYTSALGSAFVAIATYDGSAIDIVGVLVAPDSGSTVAPPAVTAPPQLTPVSGGFEVQWLPVVAGDLAGYRVYYSFSPFTTTTSNGVKSLPWLENSTRLLLPVIGNRLVWVGITAVDSDGNESALSPTASAKPLASSVAPLDVSISAATAEFGSSVTLSYSGADSFDLDLDGDGDFEITGVPAGSQAVAADAIGILRPRVRGTSGGGAAVAFGSVSLLVPAQAELHISPPSPQIGQNVYLHLSLPGAATGVEWDLDGNGTYETLTGSSLNTTTQYPDAGLLTAAVRATYLGMQLTASKPVLVQGWRKTVVDGGPDNAGYNSSLEMVSGKPAIAYVTYDAAFANPKLTYIRATDPEGTAWGAPVELEGCGGELDIAVIGGRPAIAFFDENEDVRYTRASNAAGSTWEPSVGVDTGTASTRISLVELESSTPVPAVAYSQDPAQLLVFRRGLDITGTTWSAPVYVDVSQPTTGVYCTMTIAAGNPAIAYLNHTGVNQFWSGHYVRAADPEGLTWGTPIELISAGGASGANWVDMALINNKPQAVYSLWTGSTTLVYVQRAADSVGSTWTASLLNTQGHSLQEPRIAEVAGLPSVIYYDFDTASARMIRSPHPDGAFWGDSEVIAGHIPDSIADVSGSPAMSGIESLPGTVDLLFQRLY